LKTVYFLKRKESLLVFHIKPFNNHMLVAMAYKLYKILKTSNNFAGLLFSKRLKTSWFEYYILN